MKNAAVNLKSTLKLQMSFYIEEAIQIENAPNAKLYTSAEELFAALHA